MHTGRVVHAVRRQECCSEFLLLQAEAHVSMLVSSRQLDDEEKEARLCQPMMGAEEWKLASCQTSTSVRRMKRRHPLCLQGSFLFPFFLHLLSTAPSPPHSPSLSCSLYLTFSVFDCLFPKHTDCSLTSWPSPKAIVSPFTFRLLRTIDD